MNNKISIIIPVYNTKEKYLDKCLDSAVNQDYQNKEIIVINDGSSKDYKKIFSKYKNKIKIFNTNHSGVSHARNIGIQNSTGYWITFLDSDDYLYKNSLSKIMEHIDKNTDVLLCSIKINNNGNIKTNNYEDKKIEDRENLLDSIFKSDFKYSCVDTPWAKLYKKDFLLKHIIYFNENLSNGEDGIFNYRVYYYAKNIYMTHYYLYNYRVNQESVCNTYSEDLDIKFTKLLSEYNILFNELSIKDRKELYIFSLRIFCRLLRKYYIVCDFKEFKNKIKNLDTLMSDMLNKISYKDINFKRKIVLFLYKNNLNYLLYKLMKSKIKIK